MGAREPVRIMRQIRKNRTVHGTTCTKQGKQQAQQIAGKIGKEGEQQGRPSVRYGPDEQECVPTHVRGV